ncbi:MAG: alpha/beta hydrolase [Dictyoglomi bacterium]|nr:alpha/beta hydrolase [Dictyoglomota bacterium]
MAQVKEVRLYTYQWKAETPIGVSVLIIHGLGEHAGRYKSLVKALNDNGIDVYSFDLPGHGKSPGKRGHIASFDALLDYIGRYLDKIGGTRFVLGHSLGGLIALRAAQEHEEKITGVIASSPAIYIKPVSPLLQKLAMILDKFLPTVTLSNQIDASALSRRKEEVEAYVKDPLVHDRISARLYGEMVRHIDILWKQAPNSNAPLLLQVGTEDKVVPPVRADELIETWKGPSTYKAYEGAFHELYEDPYIGTQAIADVVDFIRESV